MPKVLVADDDSSILELIRELLEEDGYDVSSASNGEEALIRVKQQRPDVLLLDFMLPKKDGYEVLVELRENENTRDLPVIMITSQDGILYPQISAAMGATYHVRKPFRTGELLELVARVIKR